jgi:hypothetical protein
MKPKLSAHVAAHNAPTEKTTQPPTAPPIPPGKYWKPAQWNAIFDWYDTVGRAVCVDLRTLALKIGRSYNTVRNKHADYRNKINET